MDIKVIPGYGCKYLWDSVIWRSWVSLGRGSHCGRVLGLEERLGHLRMGREGNRDCEVDVAS